MATLSEFSLGLSVVAAPTFGAVAGSDAGGVGLVAGIATGLVLGFAAGGAVAWLEEWMHPLPPSEWVGSLEKWRESPIVSKRTRYEPAWTFLAIATPFISAGISYAATKVLVEIA